jgi:arylsulfatase A-like enzyme
MGLAENTLVWFNSDNGGLKTKEVGIDSVGGLRGNKGTLYEGGLRVPCVIEWPKGIPARVTQYPASTMDIMPTILDILGLPKTDMNAVYDGESLKPLFEREIEKRIKPIPFHAHNNSAALIVNDYKIIQPKLTAEKFELYNLKKDSAESNNLFEAQPKIAQKMKDRLLQFNASIKSSVEGKDYPNGIEHQQPTRQFWYEASAYDQHLEGFLKRPEYKRYEKKITEKLKQSKK